MQTRLVSENDELEQNRSPPDDGDDIAGDADGADADGADAGPDNAEMLCSLGR